MQVFSVKKTVPFFRTAFRSRSAPQVLWHLLRPQHLVSPSRTNRVRWGCLEVGGRRKFESLDSCFGNSVVFEHSIYPHVIENLHQKVCNNWLLLGFWNHYSSSSIVETEGSEDSWDEPLAQEDQPAIGQGQTCHVEVSDVSGSLSLNNLNITWPIDPYEWPWIDSFSVIQNNPSIPWDSMALKVCHNEVKKSAAESAESHSHHSHHHFHMEVSINGGTPIAGWLRMENPKIKWMI